MSGKPIIVDETGTDVAAALEMEWLSDRLAEIAILCKRLAGTGRFEVGIVTDHPVIVRALKLTPPVRRADGELGVMCARVPGPPGDFLFTRKPAPEPTPETPAAASA